MRPVDALDRAVGLVIVQQGTLFNPLVAGAVHRERGTVRAICATAEPAEPPKSDIRGAAGFGEHI
jgi:hypothetical protein